jgi:hypothetical protein
VGKENVLMQELKELKRLKKDINNKILSKEIEL